MSGGVDSSYSAFLLRQNYEVEGLYLKLHNNEKKHSFFIERCGIVAANLGINFRVLDLQKEFESRVYRYFVESYKLAQTPNPCAMCNPQIKFGLGLEAALNLGCENIASGHYARIIERGGTPHIREAKDKTKDQSYFLFGLSLEARRRILFPLGDMLKSEVKPAAFAAMPWFGKLEEYKDSQEICFVEKDYAHTLARDVAIDQKGALCDKNGQIVGEHRGYMHYTIGKRKGLFVRGSHTPSYVIDINAPENIVVVGEREDLARTRIYAKAMAIEGVENGDYDIKIRYRQKSVRASIKIEGETITACAHEPIYGVANGQALVIYEGDVVLGGGFITRAE